MTALSRSPVTATRVEQAAGAAGVPLAPGRAEQLVPVVAMLEAHYDTLLAADLDDLAPAAFDPKGSR